jgi:hypothetical protein
MGVPAVKISAPDWASLKWLRWVALYLIAGVLVPALMTRAWAQQHGRKVQARPRVLFQSGELGIVGLLLATSVIWDLQTSDFMPHTVALGSILLAFAGMMAAWVWVESYCRRTTGTRFHPERAWRDSRNLAFLVFSIAAVAEVLLERFAKVTAR